MEERDRRPVASYPMTPMTQALVGVAQGVVVENTPNTATDMAADVFARPVHRSAALDGRSSHHSLLLVAQIRPGPEVLQSLERLLDAIACPAKPQEVIPFRKLSSVHFARILIQPLSSGPPSEAGQSPGQDADIPAKLLFATDFDGTLKDHLLELIEVASAGLDQLFEHCEGWPGLASRDDSARYQVFAEFVARQCVESNTFFCGTVKRSVGQILREAELRDVIETYLDAHLGTAEFPTDALGIRERLCHWIFNDPSFEWVHTRPGPFPKALLPRRVTDHPWLLLGLTVIAVAVLLVAALTIFNMPLRSAIGVAAGTISLALAVFYGAKRYVAYLAARDPVIIRSDVERRTRELVRFEDHVVQNQFSAFNYIKRPLWFRRCVLRAVLAAINVLAKYQDTQGMLSGIPSIHFARWVVVDEGRRLLFFSNFDGSWESYLGDFVDKAHEGLTAIWSNCVGFPRTVGLTKRGASDEQRFKAYARDSQVATQVWYSAYPSLTVSNINDNTRLRLGLYTEMDETAAAAWLRMAVPRERRNRVDRQPTPRPDVDLCDVQGLVARSYRDLHEAVYLPVTFDPDHREKTRAWLRQLIGAVTTASCSNEDVAKEGAALNVAFTHSGLQLLGLDDLNVVGFSREFTEGMAATAHRQRLLGDTARAAPTRWRWGGPENPEIHAMLFVFAGDNDRLVARLQAEQSRAQQHGLRPCEPLPTVWLSQNKEHFGFHDGIGQPKIAGFGRENRAAAGASPELPAGEVILGYPNAYGFIPLSPSVENRPSITRLQRTADDPARLDFGRNGSYVVFRQLQQDVKALWKYVDRLAGGDPHCRTLLAAKMVGRWPNGAPLVQYPDAEPRCYDENKDDFWYRDDLEGDRCPIGAHIRRTNPRDGLRPNTEESLTVADRHRLLRRGRAYGLPLATSFDPDDILHSSEARSGDRGLHFICFNTDIARQFEFVQNAWMNNAKFDGLYDDPDPIIAPHVERASFTAQASPVRRRYQDLEGYVTMVGGAYLFMPGLGAMRFLTEGLKS